MAGSDYQLKKKYDFRQIKIVREYAGNVPLVPCEESKLQQVLLNLLRNGAEAMHEEKDAGKAKQPRFILRLAYDPTDKMVGIEIMVVKSIQGKGTTFIIRLPLDKQPSVKRT